MSRPRPARPGSGWWGRRFARGRVARREFQTLAPGQPRRLQAALQQAGGGLLDGQQAGLGRAGHAVGHHLEQVDVLVGERAGLLTVHVDRADEFAFLEHRHRNECARAYSVNQRHDKRIFFDISII